MIIRDNKVIPPEVENYLLDYEASVPWTEVSKELEEQIELIVVTDTDIFEGMLRYYNNWHVLEVITWNSWYNELPQIHQLIPKAAI